MYWSIYDTLMVVTGISTAAIAFVPGITNKARAISVAVGVLLVVAALITGSLRSFIYPQHVLLGPVIPVAVALRLWWAARKAPTAGIDPYAPAEQLFLLAQDQPALRPTIAAHPNAYPDLVTWLGAQGVPATGAAPTTPALSDTTLPVAQAEIGHNSPESLAADPSTPAATLADLAYRYPALRGSISANPAAYADLRDWIATAGQRAPDTPPRGRNSSHLAIPVLAAITVVCLIAGVIGTNLIVNGGFNRAIWNVAEDTDINDTYDTGYGLAVKAEWLSKVALPGSARGVASPVVTA